MMKKNFTYSLMALAIVLAGCSQQDDVLNNVPEQDQRIAVSAGVNDLSVVTRTASVAVPYELTIPTAGNPLNAAVWFTADENTPTQFGTGGTGTSLPQHTTISFVNDGLTFSSPLLKYTAGKATYAVGLYPNSGWTCESPYTSATHAINGNEDLMFAKKITADANNHYTTSNKLQFGHLLTWLSVNVMVSEDAARSSWGKIKKIQVESATSLTVPLNGDYAEISYPFDLESPTYITVYEDATGTDLPENGGFTKLGSVFCAPTANGTYKIKVFTENEPEGNEVTVSLIDATNTAISNSITGSMGKQFVITLTFYPWTVIDAVGKTLTDWAQEDRAVTGS